MRGNDYKKAHQTWENNGWSQWEFHKDLENIKKDHSDLKNIITEIRNTL